MPERSQQLEQEVAEMEGRLVSAKLAMEAEKVAWKAASKTGKRGTKWRGAAATTATKATVSQPAQQCQEASNSDASHITSPMQWDALELAQFLQLKGLMGHAQVVICNQITGKLLLETPPSKLRQLFPPLSDVSREDPKWKTFHRLMSELHQMESKRGTQKIQAKNDDLSEEGREGALFPCISPRAMPTSAVNISQTQLKTKPPELSKQATSSSVRRLQPSKSYPMATCWNCGARFPRQDRIGSSKNIKMQRIKTKTGSMRLYCSQACQDAIEKNDMSISASLNLQVRASDNTSHANPSQQRLRCSIPASAQSPTRTAPVPVSVDSFDFLRVSHNGPSVETVPRPPGTASRPTPALRRRPLACTSASTTGVPSISATRLLSNIAMPSLVISQQTSTTPRAANCLETQFSRFKLDVDATNRGSRLDRCFNTKETTVNAAHIQQREANVLCLLQYLNVRAMYHLSLANRMWFGLIHEHPSTMDPIWGWHLHRRWIRTSEDESMLRELGILVKKHEKPRRVMLKLTHQFQKAVRANLKILLEAETWPLATVDPAHLDFHPPWPEKPVASVTTDATRCSYTEWFDSVALICSRKAEIVAIRSQGLVRPVQEDGTVMAILEGLRTQALLAVECHRLRLFSPIHPLLLEDWSHLTQIPSVFNLTMTAAPSIPMTSWLVQVLQKMEKQMQRHFLSNDSVEQVLQTHQAGNLSTGHLTSLQALLARCHHPLHSRTRVAP